MKAGFHYAASIEKIVAIPFKVDMPKVIILRARVTRVSVETQRIVEVMRSTSR